MKNQKKSNGPTEAEFQAAIEHSKKIVHSKGDAKAVKYPGRPQNNPFKKNK